MLGFRRQTAADPTSTSGSNHSSPIHEKAAGSSTTSFHKHDTNAHLETRKAAKAGKGGNKRSSRATGRQTRKKAMAAVIVDQLGAAVGQVALKNSKFNRDGDFGSLDSARKLARKLFLTLSDVMPPRSHLIVEGILFLQGTLQCRRSDTFPDFEPYFSSTAEAVSEVSYARLIALLT